MKKDKGNIVFVGGHAATTAYSVFLEAKKHDAFSGYNMHWIGSGSSHSGVRLKPFEHNLFPKLGINTHFLPPAKLDRRLTRHFVGNLLNTLRATIGALSLMIRLKPAFVLSFGGSISLPVVFVAWIMRVPVFIHEQTMMAGLSNKIGASFARKILLSRENSLKFFDAKKCVIVGNPINPAIGNSRVLAKSKTPKLIVLGGSRGSSTINTAVFGSVAKLAKDFELHHVVGKIDYETSKQYKFKNYHSYSFIEPADMGKLYEGAEIMVARSGANTVSEVLYLGLPTLFIPIPWTRLNEQVENAKFAEKIGIAKILQQDNLNEATLVDGIKTLYKDSVKMRNSWKKATLPHDELAAKKICEQISSIL